MRVLALDRATAAAADALRDARIDCILLKGPALARWLYDDESERPYVDADLLVSPADVGAAETKLGELGFRRLGLDTLRSDRPRPSITLRREDDGLAIDLHHSFLGIGVEPDVAWRVLRPMTEPIEVGGATLLMLTTPARAVVLSLHAAKDGSRSRQVVRDMERAVEVVDLDVWRHAVAVAERLDAVEGVRAGICRSPAGEALATRLGLPAAVSVDAALREQRPPPMAAGMKWFLEEESLGAKARVARQKLFPPPSFMRAWRPLARRGALGLALAYVWRPFWVVWHSLPAAIAVRRARRAADRSRRATG